ncbi:Trm112 family protein [uncultured Paraglaciecola sp.]|uniref:Trm112 family protein n=1 Tax=uncultured Paraglaciecola sp. TaxID=1765024 RepID=UPI0030D8CCDE|tara:strand:+ start:63720 stop:63923 length:204 start_codon:yes stop_codon:yes gene_type:complete
MAFDKKLLDILACPVCKGKLLHHNKQAQLICKFDRLVYPIRENIPVLLESEAEHLSSDDMEQLLKTV